MTRNQIAYWDLQESKRSHRAVEKETNRSNLAREAETYRSNLAREQENVRHNKVTEVETERHNRATETLTDKQLRETVRHNQAGELLNFQIAQENARANRAREAVQSAQVQFSYDSLKQQAGQIQETVRHNKASEKLGLIDAAIRKQYNDTMAEQSLLKLNETMRSNLENENLKNKEIMLTYAQRTEQSRGQFTETVRHNQTSEDETHRHNVVNEVLELGRTASQNVESFTRSVGNLLKFGGLK